MRKKACRAEIDELNLAAVRDENDIGWIDVLVYDFNGLLLCERGSSSSYIGMLIKEGVAQTAAEPDFNTHSHARKINQSFLPWLIEKCGPLGRVQNHNKRVP